MSLIRFSVLTFIFYPGYLGGVRGGDFLGCKQQFIYQRLCLISVSQLEFYPLLLNVYGAQGLLSWFRKYSFLLCVPCSFQTLKVGIPSLISPVSIQYWACTLFDRMQLSSLLVISLTIFLQMLPFYCTSELLCSLNVSYFLCHIFISLYLCELYLERFSQFLF